MTPTAITRELLASLDLGLTDDRIDRLWKRIRGRSAWLVTVGEIASILFVNVDRATIVLEAMASAGLCEARQVGYHYCSEPYAVLVPIDGLEYPSRCGLCDEEIQGVEELDFELAFCSPISVKLL
jgi:hypothetical protein